MRRYTGSKGGRKEEKDRKIIFFSLAGPTFEAGSALYKTEPTYSMMGHTSYTTDALRG